MKVKIKPGAEHGYSGLIPNDDTVYEVLGEFYGGVIINPMYDDGSFHTSTPNEDTGLGFFSNILKLLRSKYAYSFE